MPYYESFVEAYPTIKELAQAEESEVLRLWQGLGYYSRARNLHATAKYVAFELNGSFPNTYRDIIMLKGVGPYTAAAISSICFGELRPVVDGNVFRFASRFFNVKKDIGKASTRKYFEEKLTDFIHAKNPGAFNQAMMEFGSKICAPSPKCDECVFLLECEGKRRDNHLNLPVKEKKLKVKDRYFHYIVVNVGDKYLLKERDQKGVWAHLYDFPLLEGEIGEEDILKYVQEELSDNFELSEISIEFLHILSHQRIHAIFYGINLESFEIKNPKSFKGELYSKEEIVNLPKPKLIVNYFEQIGINS